MRLLSLVLPLLLPSFPSVSPSLFSRLHSSVHRFHPLGAAASNNDILALQYALTLERLDTAFFTTFQQQFNQSWPTEQANEYQRLEVIRADEAVHTATIEQALRNLGQTPVPSCNYDFSLVKNISDYIAIGALLKNTGVSAYDGAINSISDPALQQVGATIATVEARHAAYLNRLKGDSPFPQALDVALRSQDVVSTIISLGIVRSCPFELPSIFPVPNPEGSALSLGTSATTLPASSTYGPYTSSQATSDLQTLQLLYQFTNLLVAYNNNGNFSGSSEWSSDINNAETYYTLLVNQDLAHSQALASIITSRGGTPASACTYNFGTTTSSLSSFLTTLDSLHTIILHAHSGIINRIYDLELQTTVISIATVHSRHTAFIRELIDVDPFQQSLDNAITPEQAISQILATGYITSCPQSLVPPPPKAAAPIGTSAPTSAATSAPTSEGTSAPTSAATSAPTPEATSAPTEAATSAPTSEATSAPTSEATSAPTSEATSAPTSEATSAPTSEATSAPTSEATSAPTSEATSAPTEAATSAPTSAATSAPTDVLPTGPPGNSPVGPPFPGPNSNPPICPAVNFTDAIVSGLVYFNTTTDKAISYVDVHVTAANQFLNYRMNQVSTTGTKVYTYQLPGFANGAVSYWFTYVTPDAQGVLRGCDSPTFSTDVPPFAPGNAGVAPSTPCPAAEFDYRVIDTTIYFDVTSDTSLSFVDVHATHLTTQWNYRMTASGNNTYSLTLPSFIDFSVSRAITYWFTYSTGALQCDTDVFTGSVTPSQSTPATSAPTTATTSAPTTATTSAPTTATTTAPTTEATTAPTTEATSAPTTGGETTSAPTTGGETTSAPTTGGETTSAPTPGGETTSAPTTGGETTSAPTTEGETTSSPTTGGETTSAPTTGGETTSAPTSGDETTSAPTTGDETTSAPTTEGETTSAPTTSDETTSAPTPTLDPALVDFVPPGENPTQPPY